MRNRSRVETEKRYPVVVAGRLCAIIGATIAVLISLVALAGWHTGVASLIQLRPVFAPLQYNTGLGITLAGIATLLLATGRGQAAVLPAGARRRSARYPASSIRSALTWVSTAGSWNHG